MNRETINYNNTNITFIKGNKSFKRCILEILIRNEYSLEDIFYFQIITTLLGESNKDYPKYSLLRTELEERYSAVLRSNTYYKGNQIFNSFYIYFLNPKYTEKEELKKSIELLFSIIYNPNIKDEKFSDNNFSPVIETIRKNILSKKENKRKYAFQRYNYHLDKRLIEGLTVEEELALLDKFDSKKAYQYYLKLLNGAMDIYFCGDINKNDFFDIVKPLIKNETKIKLNVPKSFERKNNKEVKYIEESLEHNKQTLLFVSYGFTSTLNKREAQIILPVLSDILGGGMNSLLFSELREKLSLCYQVYTNFSLHVNNLFIYTALDSNNIQLALEKIDIIVDSLKQGKIKSSFLKNSQKGIISSIKDIDDSAYDVVSARIDIDILDIFEQKEYINQIKTVTVDEVVSLANKLNKNFIYVLKEDKNGK